MTDEGWTREVRTVSAAGAQGVLAAAMKAAAGHGLKLSIAVVDASGNLLAFQRDDGAAVTTIEAALRKARTAVHLKAPTKVFEDLLHGGATSLLAFEFISPSQGGVPLVVGGTAVVGGIGCSGGSGEEDETVAKAGAAAIVRA
ncbi:MAG: heme-binding protein [Novosphingobium sp.]|nr:heme-binding protein [Novosphingobium sp.]